MRQVAIFLIAIILFAIVGEAKSSFQTSKKTAKVTVEIIYTGEKNLDDLDKKAVMWAVRDKVKAEFQNFSIRIDDKNLKYSSSTAKVSK
jgi:hypothetical protein